MSLSLSGIESFVSENNLTNAAVIGNQKRAASFKFYATNFHFIRS